MMRIPRAFFWILTALYFGAGISSAGDSPISPVKSDERVILFPTAAELSEDGEAWLVPLHGWIFEPEHDDLLREAALRALQDALDLDPKQPKTEVFKERARLFLVDNERGKRIVIRIGDELHQLKPSDKDGHFFGTARVPIKEAEKLAEKGQLPISVELPPGEKREFKGRVHLLPPEGLSVISDIDDTIKVTHVANKARLIENTFYKPFAAVQGMAEVYAKWEEAGATFHYVSSAPWQLYEPLSAFLDEAGFPEGAIHLKRMRLKDSSFLSLFADPERTKPLVIQPILTAFPKRKFVLVGDSGEKDPEVYGALAAKFPAQVAEIFIRDVTGEQEDRYRRAFKDVPSAKWTIFREAKSLRELLR